MDLGAVVAIIRTTAGLSQTELGNMVEGWSQATVSHAERGNRHSIYDHGVYDLTGDIDMDPQDVNRRDFHGATAGLLATAFLPPVPAPQHVGTAHVRHLRAALDRLRALDRTMGGGAVLHQALRLFGRAQAMLNESDYTETTGRQLLAVTSELGIVAGWAAFDHGDQISARRLYGEAHLLAHSSGDAELQAQATIFMAWQATHVAGLSVDTAKGYAREALRLADTAAAVARHEPSPRLHAGIALRQAAAYATLGDTSAFRTALGQARRELDRGAHPSDSAWTAFVTPSGEVKAVESVGHLRLGDPVQAITLRQSFLDNPKLSPRGRIVGEGNLAKALLAAGDRTEAINTGRAILPALTSGKMTSARPLVTLKAVRAAAEQDGDEEFCGHYDAATRSLAN
jgi:hypothetical protein